MSDNGYTEALANDTVLVTGSNGFIGSKIVELLLQRRVRTLRCFVRPTSQLQRLNEVIASAKNVEIITGDLTNPADCERAAKSVSVIYHLAAGFDKSHEQAAANSMLATRNLLEAFRFYGTPRRFVCVSSFAVYAYGRLPTGGLLDEDSPVEDASQAHLDAYTYGKLLQEQTVRDFGATHAIPFVVLRPGTVFGPGKRAITGRVGRRVLGVFLNVGGSNELPLTYIDNCANAIVTAGLQPGIDGETFNVVDDDRLTSRQFLEAYRSHSAPIAYITIPYGVAFAFSAAYEVCARVMPFLPRHFSRRYCAAEWKASRFSNRKLRDRLNWEPGIPISEALDRYFSQFQKHQT